MICEKDQEERERLARILIKHRYLVVECDSRQDGLGAMNFQAPDVVILHLEPDENIPVETTNRLKEILGALKESLLFFTSRKPGLTREKTHALGFRPDGIIPLSSTNAAIEEAFQAARAL